MLEALTLPFFQRVLIAGLLASVACGLLGPFVVAKRVTSLAGGLSHAAFGGVGLGYLAGFHPMLGAAGFALAAAGIIGFGYRRMGAALDTLVSMVWAVGMALGVVFVSLAPGYAPDLMSYLFGSLLFVRWETIALVAALDVGIGLALWALYKEFQAVAFDEEFAEVVGVPVQLLFLALLGLTALGIVALIRVVGVILVIALLTVPAAIGRHWADDLQRMMGVATAVAVACTTTGLLLSFALGDGFGLLAGTAVSVPPGPLIILLAVAAYAASALVRRRQRG